MSAEERKSTIEVAQLNAPQKAKALPAIALNRLEELLSAVASKLEMALSSYTPTDIETQQAQQSQATQAEATRIRTAETQAIQQDDKKRIAQASVAAADTFQLGQDPMGSLTGQEDIFSVAPEPVKPTNTADAIKLIQAQKQAQARADIGPSAINSGVNDTQVGEFGPILTQFYHDAQGAIKALTELQTGEAVAALHHPEVGDIDLVWGKLGDPDRDFAGGYGLAKLYGKHPEVISNLQGVLNSLKVKSRAENRIILESSDHKSAISLNWAGKEKTWLLSAYEKKVKGTNGTTIYTTEAEGKDGSLSIAPSASLPPDAAIAKPTNLKEGIAQVRAKNQPQAPVNATPVAIENVAENGIKFSLNPTKETETEAQTQHRETERAYGGKAAYDKAHAEGRTKLTFGQWVQVRTPKFKAWFGDWEMGRGVQRVASTFEQAREQAKAFQGKDLTNTATGLSGRVSRNSLDKMLSQKAVGKSESPTTHAIAVANVDALFQDGMHGWSKTDRADDSNIAAIHRFFSPLMVNGEPMLAKVTVREMADATTPNRIYSVESVEFNEKSPAAQWVAASAAADGIDLTSTRSARDVVSLAQRVQEFNLDSVSKAIDPQTGEPLVVHHGTDQTQRNGDAISVFKMANGAEPGVFFSSDKDAANHYADRFAEYSEYPNVIPVFLSMPLAKEVDAKGAMFTATNKRAFSEGNSNGIIIHNVLDGANGAGAIDVFVAANSTQIKSAIGNNGNFDGASPDIRKSRAMPPLPSADTWNADPITKISGFDTFIHKIQNKHIDTKRAQDATTTRHNKPSGGKICKSKTTYLL